MNAAADHPPSFVLPHSRNFPGASGRPAHKTIPTFLVVLVKISLAVSASSATSSESSLPAASAAATVLPTNRRLAHPGFATSLDEPNRTHPESYSDLLLTTSRASRVDVLASRPRSARPNPRARPSRGIVLSADHLGAGPSTPAQGRLTRQRCSSLSDRIVPARTPAPHVRRVRHPPARQEERLWLWW